LTAESAGQKHARSNILLTISVFALDPNTGAETVIHSFCHWQKCGDGDTPIAGLIDAGGVLYGTTKTGGTSDIGTVFAVTP
jgi:uncharacterized repeat protein (TIGR03803 family)